MKNLLLACLLMGTSILGAVEYDIQDIGTLQTHMSQAIDMNNAGQILGWYQVDEKAEKRFFVRERDGSFQEIPSQCEWKCLTSSGKVYGFAKDGIAYSWDKRDGVTGLGMLPQGVIVKVNDLGQILIQSITSNEDGKKIIQPVIYKNGSIIKLRRLAGNTGIESEEAYGLDINNRGEVVGKSLVHIVYKNKIYKCFHATMWVNGEAIDLHDKMPKSKESHIFAINDSREMLVVNSSTASCLVSNVDAATVPSCFTVTQKSHHNYESKITNNGLVYGDSFVIENDNGRKPQYLIRPHEITTRMKNDRNSVWLEVTKLIKVNDNGEILAQGKTLYGEDHSIFLKPIAEPK